MSGICGLRYGEDRGSVRALAGIAGALALHPETVVTRKECAGAGIAVASRFPGQDICQQSGVSLVCDAEVYNDTELRRQTPAESGNAALFATLYERFGTGFAAKIEGAFSFILWDSRTRRLIAGVDGFGIKRLVYHSNSNGNFVCSRLDALATAGVVDRKINSRSVANLLNFSSHLAPDTILTSVERLLPGTLLIFSDASVRIEKYWDMRYYSGGRVSEDGLSRELESIFESSVATHCRNEPSPTLGAFLSGGTDSSTVTGMMTRALSAPVNAFSIGFEEQPFNELGYAEIAAKRFRASHHTYLVSPDDCFSALPEMVRFFDEPFGNSSAIPTYFCARLAAQTGVKTLLAGDGGDELFGGNERYRTDKLFEVYHSVPAALRKGIIEPLLSAAPANGGPVRRLRGYVRRANMRGVERFLSFQFLSVHLPAEVFEPDFLAALDGYSIVDIPARYYNNAPARDHLDRLLYVDMKITLADNDLPKVTCMSELAGIQVRFPFLHRPVAEFSGTVPASLKVKGFNKRHLFKKAFRELLPAEIIKKPKHGFGIPVAPWMKTHRPLRELLHDTLLSRCALERGYFRRTFIEDLFQKHQSDESTYYGDTLWTFLTFELWHRRVMDRIPVKASACN